MKRFLSKRSTVLFLSAVMAVSAIPVSAAAEDEPSANEPVIEQGLPAEETIDAAAELQAKIENLPTIEEFMEMGSEEQSGYAEAANELYERAYALSDEDYLRLDLTKIEAILAHEAPGGMEPFILDENQVLASSEAELISAIAKANGMGESPTEIIVHSDIELNSAIVLSDKNIKIVGANAGVELKAAGDTGISVQVINLLKDSNLILENITVNANSVIDNGDEPVSARELRAVSVRSGSTLTLSSGAVITGGSGWGGGIYIAGGGTVEIDGGAVTKNIDITSGSNNCLGGGVLINGGTLNLKNGSISNNTALDGGAGVSVLNGIFEMSGGTIMENSSEKAGGGVKVGSGQFNMSGGTITKNRTGSAQMSAGAGVYYASADQVHLKGAVEIYGNYENAVGIETDISTFGQDVGFVIDDSIAGAVIKTASDASSNHTVAVGGGSYTITEDDLKAITNTIEGYILYLDADANAIRSVTAVTVTFHANNGTDATATQAVPSGIATVLDADPFTAEGKALVSWNTAQDGSGISYPVDTAVTLNADTDLYAQWETTAGVCGDPAVNGGRDVTWAFDAATGVMTIGGSGGMANYEPNMQPWKAVKSDIIKVVIESGVTRVGQRAFQTAPNLRELVLKNNVVIGDGAFQETKLTSIIGQEYIAKVEGRAFKWIDMDTIDLRNATEIDEYGFEESKLKTITLGNKLTVIKDQAFVKNSSMTRLYVPDGVALEGKALYDMSAVVALRLPADLAAIPEGALLLGADGEIIYVDNDRVRDLLNSNNYSAGRASIAVLNGGTVDFDQNFTAGKLATPVKDGHIFGGWFADAACEIPAPEMTVAGHAYYAKWTPAGELTATAEGYTGDYDGKFHSVTITPSAPDAAILYSEDNEKTYSDIVPQFKNSGEYTVYYKVRKEGCLDVVGSVVVKINKIENPVTIRPSAARVYGGDTVKFTITAPEDVTVNNVVCEGIAVTKNDDGTFSAEMPVELGTYTFMAEASGEKIYNSKNEATCAVEVIEKKKSGGSTSTNPVKTPVVGTVDGAADESAKVTASTAETNKAAAEAAKADTAVTLVSTNGTAVSGNDFTEPVMLTIPVDTKNVDDVKKLTLAKFDVNEDGAVSLEIVGGSYDMAAKAVKGYVIEAGDYFVVEKDNLVTITMQISNENAYVNSEDRLMDSAPFISQSRTMVPVRFVAEAFGAKVDWVGATRTVIITMDDQTLTMQIGKELEGFGAAPVISNSRTMVPISYIAKHFGANVVWVPSTKTVAIAK